MRLTNTIRDAYIKSVMDDVPSVDFDEAIRKAYRDAALEAMPPKLRALAKDPACELWLAWDYRSVKGVSSTLSGHGPRGREADEFLAPACLASLRELEAKRKAQHASRNELRSKIRAVAYGATTRKALAEALPEFAKYLPADEAAAVRTLPALANVVTDFVKAGWPKGKTA